jgi:OOP family OmpA-OmpF porin
MKKAKKSDNSNLIVGSAIILLLLSVYLYSKNKKQKVAPEKVLDDVFENLTFETGKATINNASFIYLDRLVELLMKNLTWKLNILGHTDNQGGNALNLALSKNRAMAVKTYLVGKGIAGERIMTDGLGSSKPIADNSTPEGREKNRRVEFYIVKI